MNGDPCPARHLDTDAKSLQDRHFLRPDRERSCWIAPRRSSVLQTWPRPFRPRGTRSWPKPARSRTKLRASERLRATQTPCKPASSTGLYQVPENRGVPGSSPGLAIGKSLQIGLLGTARCPVGGRGLGHEVRGRGLNRPRCPPHLRATTLICPHPPGFSSPADMMGESWCPRFEPRLLCGHEDGACDVRATMHRRCCDLPRPAAPFTRKRKLRI